MKSWEEKKKDLFKLGARSANPNIRTTRIMVGTDVSIPGGIRGTTRGHCQRGCTLDKLWRDQRYEGNAAGINAE